MNDESNYIVGAKDCEPYKLKTGIKKVEVWDRVQFFLRLVQI